MLNQKRQIENDQARQNISSNKERIQQLERALQKYQMEIKLNEDNNKQINELKDTVRKLQIQEYLKENPVINHIPKKKEESLEKKNSCLTKELVKKNETIKRLQNDLHYYYNRRR